MLLTTNQKLAVTAFSVSLLAMTVSLTLPDRSVLHPGTGIVEHICVLHLAREIKNRTDFTLIDLRSEEEYREQQIPSAIHVPFSELLQHEFSIGERIIFYSGDDSLARQAYFMFRGMGFENALMVRGGIHDWYERIMNPQLPVTVAEGDRQLAEQVKELSRYFGGHIEFVHEGNPLDYYRALVPQSERRRENIRMGCAW